jgi:hypothetical protein
VSLAAIDPECSVLLDDCYEEATQRIAKFVRTMDPECKPADSLHRATLLVALADGITYQLGAGRRKRRYMRGFDAKFRAAFYSILLRRATGAVDG